MRNMTEGRPASLILKFSLPLLAGNVLQQMYNFVDSLVVGNFVGKEALAAVGGTAILSFLLFSLFSGIALGVTIVVARFVGSGDRARVRSTVDTAYAVAVVGALVVTVVGVFAARPLLTLLNVPAGPTFEMADTFLTIVFLGTIGNFGYNLNAGILQGLGDSASSLVFLAISVAVNVALDLVFVPVFHWGVAGVAWATVIAQLVSFALGTVFIVKKLRLTTLKPSEFSFDPRILAESVRIGLPGGVQNMLFCVGTMAIQRLVNGHGPDFMAGFSISVRIDSLAFMPIASFSSAVMTFTGQNCGAGRLDRVKRGYRATQAMSGAVCVVVSAAVFFGARFLMSLFTADAEVIRVGSEVLWRLMPCYVLLSVLFIANSALRGAGEALWPFVASFTSFMIVRMPAAYLLDHFFGKYEIGWCYGIGWVFGLAVALPLYYSGRWKRRAIPAAEINLQNP